MKINMSLIKYNDVCYVPENSITQHYGYTRVRHVDEDFIHLEIDSGQYLSLTTQDLSDMRVDFVHKEEWVRENKTYFIE